MRTSTVSSRSTSSNLSVQEFLSEFVRSKNVLDIGCVEHSANMESAETWLHKHLCRSALRVVGVDCNAEGVAQLNRRGYNVVCADAMTVDMGERFDVVIAGEIIEHVENPGSLLRNLGRHLIPGGKIVVTTPHVFFALHFLESVLADPGTRWNEEHVSWYDPFTLGNLFERCGIHVEECMHFARSRKARALFKKVGLQCPSALTSTVMMIGRAGDSR